MTLLGFKIILHKKCRSGKNSEGPAENSWVLDLCPAKRKQINKLYESLVTYDDVVPAEVLDDVMTILSETLW
jgi:hypothetical protein